MTYKITLKQQKFLKYKLDQVEKHSWGNDKSTRNKDGKIALFTVSFSHLLCNVIQRVCEAMSGYFVVLARNWLAHKLDYTVTQMKKLTVKRAIGEDRWPPPSRNDDLDHLVFTKHSFSKLNVSLKLTSLNNTSMVSQLLLSRSFNFLLLSWCLSFWLTASPTGKAVCIHNEWSLSIPRGGGVLSIIDYTGRLLYGEAVRPKGIPFSGFRYMKGWGIKALRYMKW